MLIIVSWIRDYDKHFFKSFLIKKNDIYEKPKMAKPSTGEERLYKC